MKRVLLLIGALGFVACVTTNFTLLDPTAQAYPPVPPDSVRIILDVADLDSLEFVRVAVINAKGSGIYTTESEMFKAMRERAGELGCNAILMPDLSNPGVVADVASRVVSTEGPCVCVQSTTREGPAASRRWAGGAAAYWQVR